jgi:hypothetical protein
MPEDECVSAIEIREATEADRERIERQLRDSWGSTTVVSRGRVYDTAAAVEWARTRGCRRLWLITTNDNLDAIRFYQRRGWRLAAVHPGGADRARELKPSIPEIGEYGIPIHDELEFELVVDLGDTPVR